MTERPTPGPWWVDDRRNVHPTLGLNGPGLQVTAEHRGGGSSYCIASVNYWEAPEANAHLIAAAPDMLEALRALTGALAAGLVARLADLPEVDISEAVEMAIAALEKANGR